MKHILGVIITFALFATLNARSGSLPVDEVVNGSFEDGTNGWVFSGSVHIATPSTYSVPDGLNLVHFSAGNKPNDGKVSQTTTVVPDRSYELSIDAGTWSFNTLEQRLWVTWFDGLVNTSKSVTLRGIGGGKVDWQPFRFTFDAGGDTLTLTLSDASDSTEAIDMLLDNVRLVELATGPDPEPEPGIEPYTEAVTLIWDNPNLAGTVTEFRVYEGGTVVARVPGNTNTCTLTTVSEGEHTWHATAVNAAGESEPSNSLTVIIRRELLAPESLRKLK